MNFLQTIFKPLAHVPNHTEHEETISSVDNPEFVVIPLEYPGQVYYEPLVQEGDVVRKNQIIGKSKLGNCVHASISGVVKEIKPVWTARSYTVPAVVIESNKEPALTIDEMFESYGVPFQSASQVEKLKASGVISPWTTPGKFHHEEKMDGFPEVKQIIIKGVNEEPTVFAFELLLQEKADKIIQGIRKLNNIAPNATIWLTIPKRLVMWATEKFGESVQVAAVSDEYKHRAEGLLVRNLTGINIPNTMSYRGMGVAVLSVEYLLAMVDALDGKEPFTSKYMTIAGDCLPKAITVKVPIGTSIRTVLESQGLADEVYARLLVGGPMKGIAQYSDETPLTKSAHGLYLMLQDTLPDEINLTCINCGRCTQACPINLQIHLIGRYVEHNLLEEAKMFHPEACNECGLCAYVCPAHRPLVQLIYMCNHYKEQIDEPHE
ncbi:MAG: 4Fe-4S dicluster domain-containing protein [candidate division Zixibacteria bacterium]|nr:4Fe-4S dicluster domain-containing protein [candidate division Zixibacteria bacterium]